MNSALEERLKTWLSGEGIAVPLFTGFTSDKQPQDDQTLTVFVQDAERSVGPLYRATCLFIVSTPPHDDENPDTSLGNHRSTVETVRDLLEDPPASLGSVIGATGELEFRGGFMRDGGESSIEGGRWVTTIDFIAGISTELSS